MNNATRSQVILIDPAVVADTLRVVGLLADLGSEIQSIAHRLDVMQDQAEPQSSETLNEALTALRSNASTDQITGSVGKTLDAVQAQLKAILNRQR